MGVKKPNVLTGLKLAKRSSQLLQGKIKKFDMRLSLNGSLEALRYAMVSFCYLRLPLFLVHRHIETNTITKVKRVKFKFEKARFCFVTVLFGTCNVYIVFIYFIISSSATNNS